MTLFDVLDPLKVKLKQFFCRHDDKVYSRNIGLDLITFTECKKCGRLKVSR